MDVISEKLRQIEGLDQTMLPQYCTTIKKVTYVYILSRERTECRRQAGCWAAHFHKEPLYATPPSEMGSSLSDFISRLKKE